MQSKGQRRKWFTWRHHGKCRHWTSSRHWWTILQLSWIKNCSASISIPGIKGVEFGLGFNFAKLNGCEANDQFYFENGIKTRSNSSGGINGGISNGMNVIIKTAVRPTPSVAREQKSVNLETLQEIPLTIRGRHDPCFASRISAVLDAAIAIALLDLLCIRHGYMWMR